jgi:hypothetical protein
VTVRVLELHTPGGLRTIQRAGTDADFGRRDEAVRRRLPGRNAASILARTHPGKFR